MALDGKADEALRVLEGAPLADADDAPTRVCLIATTGLACFRKGEIARGRQLYAEAIETARGIPDTSYHQAALLNYAREEILANPASAGAVLDKVRRMKMDPRAVTLGILRDRVLSLATGAPPVIPQGERTDMLSTQQRARSSE